MIETRTVNQRAARHRLSLIRCALLTPLLQLFISCGNASAPHQPVTQSVPAPPEVAEDFAQNQEDEAVSLDSLGYVEFASDSSEEDGEGVVLHKQGEAANGYYLVCAIPFATAILIDVDGNELRRWSDPAGGAWVRARLLRNGDLIVVGRGTGAKGYVIQRRTWENEVLWTKCMKAHHDIRELHDGNLLALTWGFNQLARLELGKLPEFENKPKVKDDLLAEVSAEGELLDESSLGRGLARLKDEIGVTLPAEWDPEVDPVPDMFHCNSIFIMEDPELAKNDPIYAFGNVLVSSRYQNLLFIVNKRTSDVVWHWRPTGAEWQHEASVLANGNILFFDNGRKARGYSQIVELDPLTKEIVWEYRAPEPRSFFSEARGTVAELDNGALLVANSDRGEAFQINRAGEMVWRYLTPIYNDKNERGVIRIQYYERALIDSFTD